jgi:NADH:ubiquinone oxidoreductase subunit 6 (subunit J)
VLPYPPTFAFSAPRDDRNATDVWRDLEAKLVPVSPASVILVIAAIACAIMTVRFKDILSAAIALAVLSAVIAMMFFDLDSAYAGVFELSVCAGLITALFVSVIGLTRRE